MTVTLHEPSNGPALAVEARGRVEATIADAIATARMEVLSMGDPLLASWRHRPTDDAKLWSLYACHCRYVCLVLEDAFVLAGPATARLEDSLTARCGMVSRRRRGKEGPCCCMPRVRWAARPEADDHVIVT